MGGLPVELTHGLDGEGEGAIALHLLQMLTAAANNQTQHPI